MVAYTPEERASALRIISSSIGQCEKIQPKFPEGTPQHTLLKNRIKALQIAESILSDEDVMAGYTKQELSAALPPISSIISKCDKARLKFAAGTAQHTRLGNMIKAMNMAKTLINIAM